MSESALKKYRARIEDLKDQARSMDQVVRAKAISALPPHLQNNLEADGDGTDHDNPIQKHWSRAWTAWGPNAEKGEWYFPTLLPIPWTKYRIPFPIPLPARWRRFPKLIAGYGLARWIAEDDCRMIEIPELADRWIFFWQMRGKKFTAIERQPNHPEFGKSFEIDADTLELFFGPSPIQEYTRKNFQVCWPAIVAGTWDGVADDSAGFVRYKNRKGVRLISRWDSLDDFMVFPAFGPSN